VYAGYPCLLMAWRRLAPRSVRKSAIEPTVSLVIAMHNESEHVAAKMGNCFELDYPRHKLQIIVILDAPTDGTDSLMSQYAGQGVEILKSAVRSGKASALNRGLARAIGEVVVFADARQLFEPRAIRELVANFADESVGAVSGELILMDSEGRVAGDAVGLYWRYEKTLRAMESDIHSVPGTTGAIYAIRRSLFEPLPPQTVLDDVVIPMRIVLKGKRALFDPAARAYDTVAASPEIEYDKKRRTLMGNYELLVEMPQLLLPWRNPIFVQLLSHKVGRLVIPYCLVALLLSNLFLLHGFYLLFFACQVAWYLIACAGWLVALGRGTAATAAPFERLEKNI
jgi:cellulose synthase/poly-beta-1,6-N-acetylglucosamine synthase-like glycosyltransferase